MLFPRKGVFRIVLMVVLIMVLIPRLGSEASPISSRPEPRLVENPMESNCQTIALALTEKDTMPVPAACVGGLCKIVLYTDATMGAYSEGYSMEVYY
jgi:hypothetical protein